MTSSLTGRTRPSNIGRILLVNQAFVRLSAPATISIPNRILAMFFFAGSKRHCRTASAYCGSGLQISFGATNVESAASVKEWNQQQMERLPSGFHVAPAETFPGHIPSRIE
jgi:hypothetical protein